MTGNHHDAAITPRRPIHQQPATGLVDAGDVRAHLDSVRFTFPSPGVRTLWQAIHDLDQASIELSFYTGDRHGASHYTDPLHFSSFRDQEASDVAV